MQALCQGHWGFSTFWDRSIAKAQTSRADTARPNDTVDGRWKRRLAYLGVRLYALAGPALPFRKKS